MEYEVKLTEEQIHTILKQQAQRIDELQIKIARVKGTINFYLEGKGDLKTRSETLKKIKHILIGLE